MLGRIVTIFAGVLIPFASTERGGYPPTRYKHSSVEPDAENEPPSAGRVALFAVTIAVILGALFYGLNGAKQLASGAKYGNCTTSDGRHGQLIFKCPNQGDYLPALKEFGEKNPSRKLTGVGIWFE